LRFKVTKKYALPIILASIVLVAGIFAFSSVQQASTAHVTALAGSVGLACLEDSANYTATQVDGDDLVLAFPNKAITILTLRMNTDDAADDFGFDANVIVNGAILATTLLADTAIQDAQEEIIDQLNPVGGAIHVGAGNNITLQFDTSSPMESGDLLIIEVCGLITDPANFRDADLTISAQNLEEVAQPGPG